jgi:hypothetical protein
MPGMHRTCTDHLLVRYEQSLHMVEDSQAHSVANHSRLRASSETQTHRQLLAYGFKSGVHRELTRRRRATFMNALT